MWEVWREVRDLRLLRAAVHSRQDLRRVQLRLVSGQVWVSGILFGIVRFFRCHRCVICGGPGISDAYYCKECTVQVISCLFFVTSPSTWSAYLLIPISLLDLIIYCICFRRRTEMGVQRLSTWAAARQTCSMRWKSMGSKRGEMGKREAHAPDRLSSFCGISHVVAVFFFNHLLTWHSGLFRVFEMVT